jgi:hypothetical protein
LNRPANIHNQQIVSGVNINAPAVPAPGMPDLALMGIADLGGRAKRTPHR